MEVAQHTWGTNALKAINPAFIIHRMQSQSTLYISYLFDSAERLQKVAQFVLPYFELFNQGIEQTPTAAEGHRIFKQTVKWLGSTLIYKDLEAWRSGKMGEKWEQNPFSFFSACSFHIGHLFDALSLYRDFGGKAFSTIEGYLGTITVGKASLNFFNVKNAAGCLGGLFGMTSGFYTILFEKNWTPRTDVLKHLKQGQLEKVFKEKAVLQILNGAAKTYVLGVVVLGGVMGVEFFLFCNLLGLTNFLSYSRALEEAQLEKKGTVQALKQQAQNFPVVEESYFYQRWH